MSHSTATAPTQAPAARHRLPELPYALDALAPQLSEETLRYHYLKHHQTYLDNLNRLIAGTEWADVPLEEIVRRAEGPVFNNGAQAWNHTFYFLELSPDPKPMPTGRLAEAIERDFGSFDEFREQFFLQAAALFGSGWTWLAEEGDGRLRILNLSNAGNPMRSGQKPLLCLDVWEHAYYIDYRNRRADAIAAHWQHVDWRTIENRYEYL